MYKYDVLWYLRLVKLDNEVITNKDYALSRDFNLSKGGADHDSDDKLMNFSEK